jgi:hypothetical protein
MIAGVGAEFECFEVAVIEMLRRTWSHWPQAPARLEAEEEEKEGGHASGGLLGPEGLAAPSGGEVAEWRSGGVGAEVWLLAVQTLEKSAREVKTPPAPTRQRGR